ncbi:MAG: glycosyltransferase family 2 protein [Candidatus Omnitrophota bacterium]|nr:glycosyltransferase family 2 protein [Candidatus Omnitrophota bacterium]
MKTNSKKTLISIVATFFNEEGNLGPLYSKVKEVFENIDYEFELILIDDASEDDSLEIARKLRLKDPRVKILSLTRRFGHQASLSAGIDYAEGDAVILMDSDLQHPPEVIPELLKKWREGYENVYTIRKVTKNNPFFKKFCSVIFYRIFRALTKIDLPMNSADFRLLDRKVVLQLRKIQERNRFLRGIIAWTGFRSVGIDYQDAPRHSGEIKYGFKKKLFLAIDAVTSFSIKPLYLGVVIGFIFAVLGFVYFVYVLYISIFTDTDIPGWASVASLLSILGGIQLIVVGLIGIYIGKIFEEVKQRPLYLIRYAKGFDKKILE